MLADVRERFQELKGLRRTAPKLSLAGVGEIARDCLAVLEANCDVWDITWLGKGKKSYSVFTPAGSVETFSRAFNQRLFLADRTVFAERWGKLVKGIEAAGQKGAFRLAGIKADSVDQLFYTAVISYAAATDLFAPGDRGGPGTFFEMAVGPCLSMLTQRVETSAITVPVPATLERETIAVDLSYFLEDVATVLVVPTKISSRERISQPYVHQAILDKADPDRTYRSVLCLANENNLGVPRGMSRSAETIFVKETLVPRTIALYQRYIAVLSGMYYLDPPTEYLSGAKPGLPPVRRFSTLLREDLPGLLTG